MHFKRFFTTLRKSLMARPFTISVEGNIGSGKSTFLNQIEKTGNVTTFSEPLEKWRNCQGHNLLDLMYKDPKKFAFTFQSYVQLTLVQNHSQKCFTEYKVMERSLYSARYCFVEKLKRDGILSPPEFSVIDEWFKWIQDTQDIGVDLFVYLRTEPDVVYERILKRDRSEERTVPFDYVKNLHELHEDWLYHKTLHKCTAPVFVIDANVELSAMRNAYEKFEEQILTKKTEATWVF